MSGRIRVGIVGLGRAGLKMHVPELKQFDDKYEITAGCDVLESHLELFHKAVPEAACFRKYDDLLRSEDVDLVAAALFSADHVLLAEKALAAGKRVFLEKPFALTGAGAARLKELCRRYPDRLFFRLNRRFETGFALVRRILKSGVLGEADRIRLCRHSYTFRDDWQTLASFGGGQLNNWGPHLIDHALLLLESPVCGVWSHLGRVTALGDAEDNVHFILTGENGRSVEVEISGSTAMPGNVYEVHGSRGSLVSADGERFTLKHLADGFRMPDRAASPEPPPPDGAFYASELAPVWHEETLEASRIVDETMDRCYEHLYRALTGEAPFPVAAAEALRVVETTLAIRRRNGESFPLIASDH